MRTEPLLQLLLKIMGENFKLGCYKIMAKIIYFRLEIVFSDI